MGNMHVGVHQRALSAGRLFAYKQVQILPFVGVTVLILLLLFLKYRWGHLKYSYVVLQRFCAT